MGDGHGNLNWNSKLKLGTARNPLKCCTAVKNSVGLDTVA